MGERVNIGSVLKAEAGKAVIHQVKDISRAFITGGAKEPLMLKTEGINILAMAGYRSLLDLNRLHCNNIHVMAQHYGIEAASRVIVKVNGKIRRFAALRHYQFSPVVNYLFYYFLPGND